MSRVKDSIALEFNDFSSDYTKDMINCVPYYLTLMYSLVEALPETFVPTQILDMGCGNGNLTALLLEKYPNTKYTLVDASTEMLKICKQRFSGSKLNFFECYFDAFPFDEDTYDLVVASFSFHHIDSTEKKEIFDKIYKALKSGGIFSSCDLMIHKSHEDHPKLVEEWGAFVNSNHEDEEKWNWIMEHYEAFDRPDNYMDQIKWLKEVGFSNVNIVWRKGYWVTLQAVK